MTSVYSSIFRDGRAPFHVRVNAVAPGLASAPDVLSGASARASTKPEGTLPKKGA